MSKELETALETLGKDWEQFKKSNDERLAKIEKGEGVAEITETVEKINKGLDELSEAKSKLEADLAAERKAREELEAEIDRKGRGKVDEKQQKEAEHVKLFEDFIRTSRDKSDNMSKAARALKEFEQKDVATTSGAAGGFAVPEVISRQITEQIQLNSPVRQAVKVVQVGTSDYKELVDIYGTTSGWVGETGTRSATEEPTLRERAPTMGTLYAYAAATEESLDDIFFNVGNWLANSIGTAFGQAEGIAALTGDGSNKPTGMLNATPSTIGDDLSLSPQRGASALQYVAIGSGSPVSAIDPDKLLDLVFTLRSGYRQNATWAMNSTTESVVRQIKQDSKYIWAPGLANGTPNTLLGYGVRTWEDLADLSAASNSILFGDFMKGYLMVDRAGLRITVDDNLTAPGYVKWYVRRRLGGIVLDNNAIKVGQYIV